MATLSLMFSLWVLPDDSPAQMDLRAVKSASVLSNTPENQLGLKSSFSTESSVASHLLWLCPRMVLTV